MSIAAKPLSASRTVASTFEGAFRHLSHASLIINHEDNSDALKRSIVRCNSTPLGAALESYVLHIMQGKEQVRIVCMDLAAGYRSIVRKYFPKAAIVAGRFPVIRLVNHHVLGCWREIDLDGSKNRGLIS